MQICPTLVRVGAFRLSALWPSYLGLFGVPLPTRRAKTKVWNQRNMGLQSCDKKKHPCWRGRQPIASPKTWTGRHLIVKLKAWARYIFSFFELRDYIGSSNLSNACPSWGFFGCPFRSSLLDLFGVSLSTRRAVSPFKKKEKIGEGPFQRVAP